MRKTQSLDLSGGCVSFDDVAVISREYIPPGPAGTRLTVSRMVSMIRRARGAPAFRARALHIVQGCAGRDLVCQLVVLRAWVQSVYRFRRDPYGVEMVWGPERQLDLIERQGYFEGDCDDAAVLAAALAGAIGFRTRLVLLGFFGSKYWSHVFAEALGPGGWFEFDVTRPPQRPVPTSIKVVAV